MAFDFPASPTVGQLYPATVTAGQAQYKWDGTTWVATGSVDNYVRKSGDAMSGALTLSGGPTVDLHASTKKYVDDKVASIPPVDLSSKVSKAGDTMTGTLKVTNGDLFSYRAGGTSGVLFLNSASTRLLFWDGTNYSMPGAPLYAGNGRLWGAGDFATAPVSNAREVYIGDYGHYAGYALAEPYNGGIVTGMSIDGNYPSNILARYRMLQLLTTTWWTVAYA